VHKARPTEYVKGPDVASKSERTRRCYRDAIKHQTCLDAWGFSALAKGADTKSECHSLPDSDAPTMTSLGADCQAAQADILIQDRDAQSVETSSQPEEHAEDTHAQFECDVTHTTVATVNMSTENPGNDKADDDDDEWDFEGEVCESVSCERIEIHGWDTLRDQIKADLKKRGDTLPLSKVNQLLILRNFATLRLKGYRTIAASIEIAQQWHERDGTHFACKVCSLACHYQLFEQLPREKHGGVKKGCTLLLDEVLKTAARDWLMSLKTGEVMPRCFQHALNNRILPSLNIALKKPLCKRTARRWLIKLGWRMTQIRKGVYLDGHEREDVVKYRNEEFLPRMKEFESRMTHYILDGEVLKPIEPVLAPDKKKIIPLFQDESCFHANEYKSSAWSAFQYYATIMQSNLQPGFERERFFSKVNHAAASFMSLILSMKSLVDWSCEAQMEALKWMHAKSSIPARTVMPGGTMSSSLLKSIVQFKYLRRLTQTVLLYSFLINCPPMHHLAQTCFGLLR
jgi:hypothetical protein